MANNEAIEIRRSFAEISEAVTMRRFTGNFLLTPSSVARVTRDDEVISEPAALEERCEFEFNPDESAEQLQHIKPCSPDSPGPFGIYQGGIRFPEFCCVCMKPVEYYKIVELGVTMRSVNYSNPEIDQKKQQLVCDAAERVRYWYAIPFCKRHSLFSQGVRFAEVYRDGRTRFVFQFTNRKFGKLFDEYNKLQGRWLNKNAMLSKYLFGSRMFVPITTIAVASIMIYDNTIGIPRTVYSKITQIGTLFIGIILLFLGLGILVANVGLRMKYGKGEEV